MLLPAGPLPDIQIPPPCPHQFGAIGWGGTGVAAQTGE